jgi:hypothetical protein
LSFAWLEEEAVALAISRTQLVEAALSGQQEATEEVDSQSEQEAQSHLEDPLALAGSSEGEALELEGEEQEALELAPC